MSRVIALTGVAGSGKSVAAEALEADGFLRVRFSTPLKNMLRAYYFSFGMSEEDVERRIEGDLKEIPDVLLFGKTPRYAMQTLGTEWGREKIYDGIWAEGWKIRAGIALRNGDNVVVEDCRFANEQEAVRSLDGQIIEITGRAKEDVAQSGHASEERKGLSPDIRVRNDGTRENLGEKVRKALELLAERQVVEL